jgi:serine/threonine protein kinase
MEYIDGISLAQNFKKGEIKTKNGIYADVKNAIKLLHDKNLVFADLRTPNILVVDINGCQRAKLIIYLKVRL